MAIGPYNDPNAADDVHPFNWYHNGILENYVNPVHALTARAQGSLLPGASDFRRTMVFGEDGVMPGAAIGMGPLPPLATHEPHPADTSEPRSLVGMQAPATHYQAPAVVNRITAALSGSPIAALFLGLGALVLFNEFALKRPRIARGSSRAGGGVAKVGQEAGEGVRETSKSGIDAVNNVVGGAVEAVEGATGN